MRRLIAAASGIALAFAALAQERPARELFARADRGFCINCHQVSEGPQTRADVGPRLEGTRMRAIGRDAIRAAIVDPTRANPDTVMPPYGRHRILDAREIERLVEYLHALP